MLVNRVDGEESWMVSCRGIDTRTIENISRDIEMKETRSNCHLDFLGNSKGESKTEV